MSEFEFLERRFTKEGGSPYDGIEWDYRTASIGDPNHPQFEQRGVEVPSFWSQNATNVVAEKYFAYNQDDPRRETSVRQLIDRVAGKIAEEGRKNGYFDSDAAYATFHDELRFILIHQMASFNSPVWFNQGVEGVKQTASACFILSVEDDLASIGRWYTEEMSIFQSGSGAGLNISKLRGAGEPLSRGGYSSGPVTFMRAADASAGTIQSGGRCLAPDQHVYTEHGPIPVKELAEQEEFICVSYDPPSARYRLKRAQAWFAGEKDLVEIITDKGSFRVSNDHPVKLSDGSARPAGQIERGNSLFSGKISANRYGEISLDLKDGAGSVKPLAELVAEDIFGFSGPVSVNHLDGDDLNNSPKNLVVEPLGESADPGPSPSPTASELVSSAFVVLNQGGSIDSFAEYSAARKLLEPGLGVPDQDLEICLANEFGSFANFVDRVSAANHRVIAVNRLQQSPVYDVEVDCKTADNKSVDSGHNFLIWPNANPTGSGIAVFNTRRAAKLVCLDIDHPDVEDFITCKAREEDRIHALRAAGFEMSMAGVGERNMAEATAYQNANNSVRVSDEYMQALAADEDWSLLGRNDGKPIKTIPARELMKKISEAAWRCADPGVQYNTTINDWHTTPENGPISGSNPCCFTGDTLVDTEAGRFSFEELLARTYVGNHPLPRLLGLDAYGEQVEQELVRVWKAGETSELLLVNTISGHNLKVTPEHLFLTPDGYRAASELVGGTKLVCVSGGHDAVHTLESFSTPEPVAVYDLEVSETSNFPVAGSTSSAEAIIVHNSEYMSNDNTACNLASINLLKFLGEGTSFDTEKFGYVAAMMFLAQEITISYADFPTKKIAKNTRTLRQIGLGYSNLGALLMALAHPYDSDEGRNVAGSITALMTAQAYLTSTQIAKKIGPFEDYPKNAEATLRVLNKHRKAARGLDPQTEGLKIGKVAKSLWNKVVSQAKEHGLRNSQATVLAPTGTISFMMDCDTTGIEPDFSLIKHKTLAGGGSMQIINKTVPEALRRMGYTQDEIDEIIGYIEEEVSHEDGLIGPRGHAYGAPHIQDGHARVFDCAVGEHAIHHRGHLKMMAAAQPFLSGAISKCVVGESILTSDSGLIEIGSLYAGEAEDSFRREELAVAGRSELKQTDQFYFGGPRQVLRAQLETGHEITGTPNHQLLIEEDGAEVWRRLDELDSSDRVIVRLGADLWGSELLIDQSGQQVDAIRARELAVQFSERVPALIMASPRPIVIAYLSELLQAHVCQAGMISWRANSEEMAGQLQAIWTNIGIVCRRDRETINLEAGSLELALADQHRHDPVIAEQAALAGAGSLTMLASATRPAETIAVSVASVSPAGLRDVYDLSVPDGHDFVCNGIVNHNTVNLPGNVTPEDIADVYVEGWKLGLKSVAIYRDGSKTLQPLAEKRNDRDEDAERAAEERVTSLLGDGLLRGERRPVPREAEVASVHFSIGQVGGYLHVRLFEDGTPGAVFVDIGKAGSTLNGFIRAWAITMSLGLQYGLPLDVLASKLAWTEFAPQGFTDDPEIRSARSIVDYVIRWMAASFLDLDESSRSELGLGVTSNGTGAGSSPIPGGEMVPRTEVKAPTKPAEQKIKVRPVHNICPRCGSVDMVPTGSCMTCRSCGETGGCG